MKKHERTAQLLPSGQPKWVRVYDNKGETADRYTVVFTKKRPFAYLGMSAYPYHPQGIGQYGESKYEPIDRPTYSHLGKRIDFASLPQDCQRAAIDVYREIWGIND